MFASLHFKPFAHLQYMLWLKKFNTRCNIANYADNIQDGSERLGDVLIQRHFVDVETVKWLMKFQSSTTATSHKWCEEVNFISEGTTDRGIICYLWHGAIGRCQCRIQTAYWDSTVSVAAWLTEWVSNFLTASQQATCRGLIFQTEVCQLIN